MAKKRDSNEGTEYTSEASSTADDLKNTAQQAFSQAKEKVGQSAEQVTDQVKDTARSQLSQRKDQVADSVEGVAQALRKTSDQLRDNDSGPFGNYVSRAADALTDVSQHLRENDLNELLHEAENFGLREPAILLGGAFALGIIAARFLKSSAQRTYDGGGQRLGSGGQYGSQYGNSYGSQYGSQGASMGGSFVNQSGYSESSRYRGSGSTEWPSDVGKSSQGSNRSERQNMGDQPMGASSEVDEVP